MRKDYFTKDEAETAACPKRKQLLAKNREFCECTLPDYKGLICKGILYLRYDGTYHCSLIEEIDMRYKRKDGK